MEHRHVNAHDVLAADIQLHLLLGEHQGLLQHIGAHDSAGNGKAIVDTHDHLLHLLPQLLVPAHLLQEFFHQVIPLVLQETVAAHGGL